MRLVPGSFLTSRPMWIVGSYEKEIQGALNYAIGCGPQRVIDIGSANGYYMVGLAIQLPEATVIGFEAQAEGHWEEAKKLADANGVTERVVQKGRCATDKLREHCLPESFVLCDCEGGELELLDPFRVPTLRSCFIICEVHDCILPGLTGRLVSRFKRTHEITIVSEEARNPEEYPSCTDCLHSKSPSVSWKHAMWAVP